MGTKTFFIGISPISPNPFKTMSNALNRKLPPIKRILVVGSGGRENALAWALIRSQGIEMVFVTPGNGGTENHKGCKRLAINENDTKELIRSCSINQIDLVVIGPEAPLAAGLADQLRQEGLIVFGPGANGSLLEASKTWAKALLEEANIPTAKFWSVNTEAEALSIVSKINVPLVVKADGLAAGKGVTVPSTIEETKKAIHEAMNGKFGEAGTQIVLEERLSGPEVSVFALTDGERLVLLPSAQDHKRLLDNDQGPNTGGMGAYSPAPHLNEELLNNIKSSILEPTLKALQNKKINYRGVLYAGLMLTKSGPQVIEFNCRFGDPECQTLMPLMGKEFAQILYACALGRLDQAPKLEINKNCSACVVTAADGYPEAPRKGDEISVDLVDLSPSIQIFHSGTKLNSKNQLLTDGGRVLSIVAQGATFDEAFDNVYKCMGKITYKGINFRQDIGKEVRQTFQSSQRL